ncbi:MAG: plasmid recombination protein [Rhodocyclaceae bacterium]|nr:plasmid recombination protein [Rhodocyclaceae bacterium]
MATNNGQFLRLKKLTGKEIVQVAMKHNLRELQKELGAGSHIDASRTHLNKTIAGLDTAVAVKELADRLMLEAKVPNLRKDAVRAIEIIFSLPPVSTINHGEFFDDALAWSIQYFNVPVLSAAIHNDEAAPHCHVVLLPLINGRMVGSDLMGGRGRLQALQTNFYEQVGARHGLTRPKAQPRLSAATRSKAASLIFNALQENPDLLDRKEVEQALLDTLARHPEPLLNALNLAVPSPTKPGKSFAETVAKLDKRAKHIGIHRHSKPIGIDPEPVEKELTLSCVGLHQESPPIEAAASPVPAIDTASNVVPFNDYQRVRDGEQSAQQWDSDRGEFVSKPEPSKPSVRDGAKREVDRLLKRRV